MTERTSQILDAAVREFIKTGEPVSSASLYEKYDFGIRPAMIRAELAVLAEDGYLVQPHHSSGRVPSDAGFEFFADRALESASRSRKTKPDTFVGLVETEGWDGFLDAFSRNLGLMGIVSEIDTRAVHRRGLEYLVSGMVSYAPDTVADVVRDLEYMQENIHEIDRFFPEEGVLEIFVGGKSPFIKNSELSFVVGDCDKGEDRALFMAIGPKRMNYERAIKIFMDLKNCNKINKN